MRYKDTRCKRRLAALTRNARSAKFCTAAELSSEPTTEHRVLHNTPEQKAYMPASNTTLEIKQFFYLSSTYTFNVEQRRKSEQT